MNFLGELLHRITFNDYRIINIIIIIIFIIIISWMD